MNYLWLDWQKLKERLRNKNLLLFLDYDGTLSPIVDRPQDAVIPKETRAFLEMLMKYPKTKVVIVSGRALEDIKDKVGLKDIIYVGNHGLEIEGPKIKFKNPSSLRYKVIIDGLKNELIKRLSLIKGVILEDKGFSFGLHYRLVDKELISKVKTIIRETTITYVIKNKIKVKSGKMVSEITPYSVWDKGRVVLWLLARQSFALKDNAIAPIYIGDDESDEDAFAALKNKGITVFVGNPRPSYAQYYLKDTDEVMGFLKRILEIQKGESL